MFHFLKVKARVAGLPPGHLEYTGTASSDEPARLLLIDKKEKPPQTRDLEITELPTAPDQQVWLDVAGVHDTKTIAAVGQHFGVHALILEDLVNTVQRPKAEVYEDDLFIVVQMPRFVDEAIIETNQISFVLSKNRLLSFREAGDDPFLAVRERLHRGGPRLTKHGLDYLTYALLDTLVDQCSLVFQTLETQIENVELELDEMSEPDEMLLSRIHTFRKTVVALGRAMRPLADVCIEIQKNQGNYFQKETRVYLRDVHDHISRLCEILDATRERLKDMVDLYLTYLSHHTNRVMQTFTMLGGIFIPLTFVAGLYGMNFQNMPELSWKYGYPMALGIMALIGIGLFFYLRLKRWL